MKYFTIEELSRSDKAKRLGMSNAPSKKHEENLVALVEAVLDPLREAYGSPIYVNSGYRSPGVNQMAMGAKNSQHMCENGDAAADITTGSTTGNEKLFNMIIELQLPFDQLIDESGFSWIHVSHKSKGRNRKQILHL